MSPAPPSTWTPAELQADAAQATSLFRADRLAALNVEQAIYKAAQADYASVVGALLAATKDLTNITGDSLKHRDRLNIARQLAVPPISVDDLDTLTDGVFGNWLGQTTDKGVRPTDKAFKDAASIISARIDRARAPWLAAGRSPSKAERKTFVEWAASGPAAGRILTHRRSTASATQEEATRDAAKAAGYKPVRPPGALSDPLKQMDPATYATAARKLTGTSMDVPIRMKAGHPTGLDFLAIECKVSNSSLNSRKRLIEVVRKREVWDGSAALYSFRTAAVLSGVFDVRRLTEAQQAGVWLLWGHRLSDLTTFLSL